MVYASDRPPTPCNNRQRICRLIYWIELDRLTPCPRTFHLVLPPQLADTTPRMRIFHSRSTIGRIRFCLHLTFPSVPSRFFASIAISNRGLDWNGGLDCREDWIITESSEEGGRDGDYHGPPLVEEKWMVKHGLDGRWWLEIGGVLWRVVKAEVVVDCD